MALWHSAAWLRWRWRRAGSQQQAADGRLRAADRGRPRSCDHAARELPPVDASLAGAPQRAFTAIEPSEVGVFGAPDVHDRRSIRCSAPEAHEEARRVHLTVRETGDDATADIVRAGLQDDSVSAGHVRIEFRREPEGWFPTNAYRRSQCARGGEAGQWTSGLCP